MRTQQEAMEIIRRAVFDICLGFPETSAVESHGHVGFKARKRMFAWYTVNHHGDNRIGLQLFSGHQLQQACLEEDAETGKGSFYLPAYTAGKGWVGMELNLGLPWSTVYDLTRGAWLRVVPARLAAQAPAPPELAYPVINQPMQLDPMLLADNAAMLERIRAVAMALPEVTEARQFGSPCFKAGKKTFCTLHYYRKQLGLQIWAGATGQILLDDRYSIPAYIGHNGWIELDLTQGVDDAELQSLMLTSYRHFALKRMLKQL